MDYCDVEGTQDNEEAAFHYAVWDIDYFLQQGLVEQMHAELSEKSKEILKNFYAGKC